MYDNITGGALRAGPFTLCIVAARESNNAMLYNSVSATGQWRRRASVWRK